MACFEFPAPALVFGKPRDFLFEQTGELFHSQAGNQKLHAGFGAVLLFTQPREDPGAGLREGQHVVGRDEILVESGLMGQRSETATDVDLETVHQFAVHVLNLGNGADVMHHRQPASVVLATGKSNLEFAPEVLGVRMAQQEIRHRLSVRRHVEGFVAANARIRAAGDIANDVAASFLGSDAGLGKATHQIGRVVDVDEVILDILACRNVADAVGVFFRQVGQRVHLGVVQQTHRDLDALHLNALLALPVNPVPKAKLEKNLLGHLPGL